MVHYCQRTTDGLIHVTNTLGTQIGQHHVHTQDGFAGWLAEAPGAEVEWLDGCRDCTCGQQPA